MAKLPLPLNLSSACLLKIHYQCNYHYSAPKAFQELKTPVS